MGKRTAKKSTEKTTETEKKTRKPMVRKNPVERLLKNLAIAKKALARSVKIAVRTDSDPDRFRDTLVNLETSIANASCEIRDAGVCISDLLANGFVAKMDKPGRKALAIGDQVELRMFDPTADGESNLFDVVLVGESKMRIRSAGNPDAPVMSVRRAAIRRAGSGKAKSDNPAPTAQES